MMVVTEDWEKHHKVKLAEQLAAFKRLYQEATGNVPTKENLYASLLYDRRFVKFLAKEILGEETNDVV